MLIYYSIAAFELLERKMTQDEKQEVVTVFINVGKRMGIQHLPEDYLSWAKSYDQHLQNDIQHSRYTNDLFIQYKKHLGSGRFFILKEAQKALVPKRVATLLSFKKPIFFNAVVPGYKFARLLKADKLLKKVLLPAQYKQRISALDRQHT
jgi:hypothetical protein